MTALQTVSHRALSGNGCESGYSYLLAGVLLVDVSCRYKDWNTYEQCEKILDKSPMLQVR